MIFFAKDHKRIDMYIILGATGNVGSAVAETLLLNNQKVTVVTREKKNAQQFADKGAVIAEADVLDVQTLTNILNTGKRAFILNPPAAPSADMVQVESKSKDALIEAIRNSSLEKIVVESTYGAQKGDAIGDLGVLYELEKGLKDLPLSVTFTRGAYYMSNWKYSLETAKTDGKIYTLYPIDFKLPMVAPADIGRIAAQLLRESKDSTGIYHVEGPAHYSSADVAIAFSKALNKKVEAVEIPPARWKQYLEKGGFSPNSAESMMNMTRLTIEQGAERVPSPIKGKTTLAQYIESVVKNDVSKKSATV